VTSSLTVSAYRYVLRATSVAEADKAAALLANAAALLGSIARTWRMAARASVANAFDRQHRGSRR
jgi:hypothetical protein